MKKNPEVDDAPQCKGDDKCYYPVVNKKYRLCQKHNWERMHPGESYGDTKRREAFALQQRMFDKQKVKPKKVYKLKPRKQTPIKKSTKKIKPRSTKRAKEERWYYSVSRPEYLAKHPVCEFEGCLDKSVQIHHKKGRIGDLLNDQTFFMAVCDEHHKWIERNPKAAKKRGYSVNRLT